MTTIDTTTDQLALHTSVRPTEADLRESKSFPLKNALCLASILAVLFIRFFRTIVFGKSLSKLFLLGHWDPLFSALRAGQNFVIDGTLLIMQIPSRFLLAQSWHHAIPLWNESSGFGVPLLADPQSFAFSPIYALFFLFPTMYVWNQIIVIELAIGAICTYLLCLELEFSFIAAFSAALLFAFCPWVQWQSELIGNGICLTPFVFLFFTKAARKQSIWFTVLAGIAAAIDVLAAHPEMAFVTIAFATMLMCLTNYRQNPSNFSLRIIFGRIMLAGCIAFGLSAPMLIPFREFVANGYTYKLTEVAPANITWQALIANYLYPFHKERSLFWGASAWLGLASLILLPIKRTRFALGIFICAALSILATTKLFPLSILYTFPPFSYIEPIYCLPEYVAFVSILSGLGISSLINWSSKISWKKLIALISLTVAPVAISALIAFWHPIDSQIRTDQAAGFVPFSWKFWSINAACLAGLLVLWGLTRTPVRFLRWAGFAGFTALSIGNLLFVAHNSLPIRPSFAYPKTLPLEISLKNGSRFLTVGSRIFRHNTNLAYGLNNVQACNPLLPTGFVEFMEACGAQTNDRFSQIFSPMISQNIDFTGTSTIISGQPLLDETAFTTQPATGTLTYTNMLSLSNIRLFYDPKTEAIFCSLIANPYLPANDNCCLDLDIVEAHGLRQQLGEPQAIAGWRSNQKLVFSGFLPADKKHWTLCATLWSDKEARFIRPSKTTIGSASSDGSWTVASSNELPLFSKISTSRFQPMSHYQNIVAYKNTTALKRYFFANKVVWVKEHQNALDFIKTNGKRVRSIAIMEEEQRKQFEDLACKMQLSAVFDNSGSAKKLDVSDRTGYFKTSSALGLETETKHPTVLVISDLYYPGWKAFLDGKDWPIFRADYLFRAVIIPAGKHHILFEYHPLSFTIGASIFLVTVVALALFLAKRFFRRRIQVMPIL